MLHDQCSPTLSQGTLSDLPIAQWQILITSMRGKSMDYMTILEVEHHSFLSQRTCSPSPVALSPDSCRRTPQCLLLRNGHRFVPLREPRRCGSQNFRRSMAVEHRQRNSPLTQLHDRRFPSPSPIQVGITHSRYTSDPLPRPRSCLESPTDRVVVP